MKLSPLESALLRVTKASVQQLEDFDEGVHWTSTTNRSLTDLCHQASADRLQLSNQFLQTGNKLMRTRPPQYRSAISRFYYSMYHAARAVVFHEYKGDDHQAHSKLPTKLPQQFPNSAIWQNKLKNAKGFRNDADYEPYPADERHWRSIAVTLNADATQLIQLARQHLRAEGCAHV